jgi:hypothetical protein
VGVNADAIRIETPRKEKKKHVDHYKKDKLHLFIQKRPCQNRKGSTLWLLHWWMWLQRWD